MDGIRTKPNFNLIHHNAYILKSPVVNVINVSINSEDIEIVYKLHRAVKGSRTIIANFCSHESKAKLRWGDGEEKPATEMSIKCLKHRSCFTLLSR